MRLTNCTRSLLGIVTSLLNLSECLHMTVRPDKDATVTVSSSMLLPLEQCSVCKVNGVENDTQTTCHSSLVLVPDEDVTLLFNCTEPPQSAFGIQVHRKIECTNDTCSPATGVAQPSLFSEFIRTLVWDLSVPEKTIMSLDFPGDRLKEMTESELCQDGYQYAVTRTNTEGEVKTQTYCKNGLVAHLHIPSQATVSLQVQKGREVDSSIFTATAKPIKKQSRMISVTPEPGTIVTISRNTKAKECSVCVGEGPTCNPKELVLRAARNTSVKFTCPQPQDVFSVEINRGIDCTEITCTGNIVQAESSLFPDFNRTFTWDLKVPPGLSFQLDFPSPGMRQIAPSETCPDEHTYTIITYLRTGLATIGIFCPGGSITTVQVLYKGRVSLQVPRDRKLEPLDFKVTVGPEIKMLAVVKVNLPRGVSDSDFLSANYFRGFPDDDLMRWDFTVPGMHNYTVNFLNHTESLCRKKEVMVMYHKARGKVGIQKTLVDPQPTHRQGSFTMTLFNCETDRTKPGLSLKFRVSVMRSGHPVLCTVHLPEEEGPVLHFEKRGSDPYCEMRKDSVLQEKITVPSGTKARLSFLDCPSEDLRLTAVKTIGCQSLDSCSVTGTLLTVPKMPTCLPTLLQSFTWHLIIPVYGTVDLLSPTGNLRQSLPGQECNGSVSLHIAEGDGSSIGNFCSEGIIHKVQVHSNVSVTATAKDLSLIQGPFLNVSFSEEISDSIIYTVQPRIGSPALLATPNWPSGMKPYSTVSWIINLPGHLQADLLFTNISQPKCGKGHTFIKVQTLGSPEEILSRREDKEAEDKLMVPESFYLNMSNCMPEDGHFSVLSKVTLQKTSKLLLSGILGAVGAVVLLMLIVLTVCLVLRKKKRMMVNEASIYKGKGNIFIPGDDVFPKTQSDSESHIYASIEDTMVYSHLLREPSYVGTVQDHFQGQPVDTYRTFMALQDGVPEITETAADHELVPEMDKYRPFLDPSETFVPSRPRTPIDRQDSMGFTDRRMVDNELYTFKSTGDINTIRLSGVDQILDPEESI